MAVSCTRNKLIRKPKIFVFRLGAPQGAKVGRREILPRSKEEPDRNTVEAGFAIDPTRDGYVTNLEVTSDAI